MQYHIQTTPIWEAFRSDCACPVCALYERTQARIVTQYGNEAVMEPAARVRVNKRGFCTKHLKMLYEGENKLGLALQVHTRSQAIAAGLKKPSDDKAAAKEAARIESELETCVICDTVDELMIRYAYTIAQMFIHEPEFPALFAASRGFCLKHYALLLENAHKAGRNAPAFLSELYRVQHDSMNEICASLEGFTNQYDYRSARATAGARDALPRAIEKLKGPILDRNKK